MKISCWVDAQHVGFCSFHLIWWWDRKSWSAILKDYYLNFVNYYYLVCYIFIYLANFYLTEENCFEFPMACIISITSIKWKRLNLLVLLTDLILFWEGRRVAFKNWVYQSSCLCTWIASLKVHLALFSHIHTFIQNLKESVLLTACWVFPSLR